jgi:hypothetical protein
MISEYTQEQILAKQLMFRFRCRKDGILADSIQTKERQGIPAWGVSVFHIKEISTPYFGNQNLAFELLYQNMREARIAAAFIMDGSKLAVQDISTILKYLITSEMIEQFSMRVFPLVPSVERFFLQGVENKHTSSLYVRAALLTLGRVWRQTDNLTETKAKSRLALILNKNKCETFQLEDQLSFAVKGILIHFPNIVESLPMDAQTEFYKLTV